MNLYELLGADIKEYGEFWNCGTTDLEELFRKEDAVKAFIFRFLDKHVGEAVREYLYRQDYKEPAMKNTHTAYVFLIGALLRNVFDGEFSIESNKAEEPYMFAYLWSLISIGHDLGCLYEKECEGMVSLPECWNSVYFRRAESDGNHARLRWYRNHGLYIPYAAPGVIRHRVNGNRCPVNCRFECEKPIKFSNQTIVRKSRYNGKIKEKHFFYQLERYGVLDHGIIGADAVYSRLLEWYIVNYRKNVKTFQSFENERLEHFGCEQFKIFIYIANCIASHNICATGDELMHKLSYKEDPLLFLFCVADALDPSKRLKNLTMEEMLKGLEIYYNREKNRLLVRVSPYIAEYSYGKLYMQDILRLSEWCEIKTFVQVNPL